MRKTTVATVSALLSLGCVAYAHPGPHHRSAKAHRTATKVLICPVTGIHIASVAKAVGHTTFKGKTYYLCCAECKPRFDKAPAKFIKNAARGKFEKM